MTTLTVDVWSDIACPWCRIGRANLSQAIALFPHGDDVVVTWHSFELDPHAPTVSDQTLVQRLADKYHTDDAGVATMFDNVRGAGERAGLRFGFEQTRPVSTFDAHRLLHLAHESGRVDRLLDALFEAYHESGVSLADPDALTALAVRSGLEEARVRQALASDDFADAVRADEDLAARLGISGVPFFVLAGHFGLSGAQPVPAMLAALNQAWDQVDALPASSGS